MREEVWKIELREPMGGSNGPRARVTVNRIAEAGANRNERIFYEVTATVVSFRTNQTCVLDHVTEQFSIAENGLSDARTYANQVAAWLLAACAKYRDVNDVRDAVYIAYDKYTRADDPADSTPL